MEYKMLKVEQRFEPKSCRHFVNDQSYVLHCHHFSTLYTQLALDAANLIDAPAILTAAAEDSFRPVFDNLFCAEELLLEEKMMAVQEYYSFAGLGEMKIACMGQDGGEVILYHSHLDEGWLKKWGQAEKPVNFITRGLLAAFFSAAYHKPSRFYSVREDESIACGAQVSKLVVVCN